MSATISAVVTHGVLELPDGTLVTSPVLSAWEGSTIAISTRGNCCRSLYLPNGQAALGWVQPHRATAAPRPTRRTIGFRPRPKV